MSRLARTARALQILAMPDLMISTFTPFDQDDAKALILSGLIEHWGTPDYSLNPDLNDIATSYAGQVFLVARLERELVGTGALIFERQNAGRIVRMSVAKAHRRAGIASRVLTTLVTHAQSRGYDTLVLETTETWHDAIAFYLRHGFRPTHHANGEAHFVKQLC